MYVPILKTSSSGSNSKVGTINLCINWLFLVNFNVCAFHRICIVGTILMSHLVLCDTQELFLIQALHSCAV